MLFGAVVLGILGVLFVLAGYRNYSIQNLLQGKLVKGS